MVKNIGDAVLLEFDREVDALQAVMELKDALRAEAERMQLPRPRLRTGVHAGPVAVARDGDVFGDAVNVAARIQGRAEPEQILASANVAEDREVAQRFSLREIGNLELKNVPEPVACFEAAPPGR